MNRKAVARMTLPFYDVTLNNVSGAGTVIGAMIVPNKALASPASRRGGTPEPEKKPWVMREEKAMRRLRLRWIVLGTLAVSGGAVAQDFEFGDFTGNIKSRLSFGAAVRTENPDASLIGKLNLNPNLCGASDCISFSGDTTQNQKLVNAPGAYFGANKDNGDLN